MANPLAIDLEGKELLRYKKVAKNHPRVMAQETRAPYYWSRSDTPNQIVLVPPLPRHYGYVGGR